MEDEDILEAGIRIIASRQEKLLDAAFRRRKSVDSNFFSICDRQFKPIAVCLLDEIDGAG